VAPGWRLRHHRRAAVEQVVKRFDPYRLEKPVRTLPRVLAVAATSTALVTGAATSALAAPMSKGTTTVAPSALTGSVLLGLTGPARLSDAGAVFGIVGNTKNGVIKHVGGLTVKELDPSTAATSVTLSNFWVDTNNATVSAIVNDGARAVVFTLGGDGTLSFTAAASQAVAGNGSLTGLSAGVATVALA
jgi:hypothetical protein